jgi:GNAT superfamily N-acetyltransferase
VRVVRAKSVRLRDEACRLAKEHGGDEFLDLCRNSEEIWVALEGGKVVAAAGAELVQDAPTYANLTFCLVHPSARGAGLQRALLKRRLTWAAKEGAELVRTYAHKRNTPSLRNLLDAGFVPSGFTDPFLSVEISV